MLIIEEEAIFKQYLKIAKKNIFFLLLVLTSICFGVILNYYSNGFLFPIFFLIPVYVYIKKTKEMPWYILLSAGVLYDFLYETPILIHVFLFLIMHYGWEYLQKFTFERSIFKGWSGFFLFSFSAYFIHCFMIFFINDANFYVFSCQLFFSYLMVTFMYPFLYFCMRT